MSRNVCTDPVAAPFSIADNWALDTFARRASAVAVNPRCSRQIRTGLPPLPRRSTSSSGTSSSPLTR